MLKDLAATSKHVISIPDSFQIDFLTQQACTLKDKSVDILQFCWLTNPMTKTNDKLIFLPVYPKLDIA